MNIPTSWNELTAKQLLYIAEYWELWCDMLRRGDPIRRARILILLQLCGLSRKDTRKLCNLLSLVTEQTDTSILTCTEFLFEKYELTKNLLPRLFLGWSFKWDRLRSRPVRIYFAGPEDRLADLTIDEFSFAFACYLRFEATRKPEHLTNLVAVLYRPESADFLVSGERKVPFTNKLIEEYAKRTARLSYATRFAVFLFFKSCIEYYAAHPKTAAVFKRAEDEERASGGSFIDTVIALSGGELGPFSETKQTNLPIFLKLLHQKIVNSRKEK